MNPSYLLVRRPLNDAIARNGAWIDRPELAPPQEVAEDTAFDLALEDDQWKGLAVYICASGPGTVFEEISGGLGARPAEAWVRLADGGDLAIVSRTMGHSRTSITADRYVHPVESRRREVAEKMDAFLTGIR